MNKRITTLSSLLLLVLIPFGIMAQNGKNPVPAGGKSALKEFIHTQLVYPAQAAEEGVEGSVKLRCEIAADGALAGVKTLGQPDTLLLAEALRLAGKIVWEPANLRGKAIDGVFELEIEFNLKKHSRWTRKRGWEQPAPDWDLSPRIFAPAEIEKPASPQLPEGVKFGAFVMKNLRNPEAAKKQGINGTVKLRFVVEPDGTASNFLVEEYLGMGCTEEAIRVIRLLKWNPASAKGKKVRSRATTTLWFGEGRHDYDLQSGFNTGTMM